ncbi:MAG: hypothetical protein ACHBN1_08065 [Heteroscytonema crispum UTEX LB 1556]
MDVVDPPSPLKNGGYLPTNNYQPPTTNPTGEPVAWVGKPYQGRPFTTNNQPPTT